MKSYTPKENIMSLIEEHNSKEAIIEYINENKLSLTEIEFIQEVELPFCDNKIKECIEATNGNLQGYFIDRKKALENILSEFQNKLPQPIAKRKPELTISQIALKYAYEGLQITRESSNEIVKKFGWNSGDKLFNLFSFYSSPANRKGRPTPCTPKKLDNKIKLIESIIDSLPRDKQGRAKDEVIMLKKIYEAEFR